MYTRPNRLEKARQDRFVKQLEEARDILDGVLEKAERGSPLAFDSLEQFSRDMDRIYRHAERMEDE